MKRISLCVSLLLFIFSFSALAVEIKKEWSMTQKVTNWDISHSGKNLGFINDNTYLILDSQGKVIKQGKNIWRGDWIQVSDDRFIIGNGVEGINRAYTYQGGLISFQDCWVYSHFSPSGKYILYGWGSDTYALCKADGTMLAEKILFTDWEPIYFSPSEKYLTTPYSGLYRIGDEGLTQLLEGMINYATFAGNEDYLILSMHDENYKNHWKMYDKNMNLIWTKDDLKGKIYGYKNGYVTASDRMLTIANLNNQVIAERSLSTSIQGVYILNNKDFFIVATADKFYLFNYSGKNIVQIPHTFTDLIWITPDGERIYTFNETMLKQESIFGFGQINELTVTSYRIRY